MKDVSISQLRAHLPEYIRMARRKGPIRILSRGHEVARLIPAQDSRQEARRKLDQLRQKAKVGDLLTPVLTDWEVFRP